MQTVETLALRIYGGPLGAGLNPQALVAVGSIPDNFRPMPPTIVDESQSWMITHAQGYTSYAMYVKEGVFAGDGIPGQLMFYLFLPATKRLANGKSVLGLLDSLYDEFSIHNMMGGHLPQKPIDNSTYTMLLRRYRLEDRPMQLPVMSGNEPAALCMENRAQLEALMRHSRYNELLKVGRLELGMRCNSTITLSGLSKKKQTPSTKNPTDAERKVDSSPASYEIYVNDRPTGKKLVRPDDMYRSSLQSTKFAEYDNISFSLSELLLAPNFILKIGASTIQLDVTSRSIRCTIPKRDIMYKVVFILSGSNENDQRAVSDEIKNGNIRVVMGSEDITELKEIKAADLVGKELFTYPKSTDKYLLSVKSTIDPAKRELRVKILITRKAETPAVPPLSDSPQQPRDNKIQEHPQKKEEEKSFLNQNVTRKELVIGLTICLIIGIFIGSLMSGNKKADEPISPQPVVEIDPYDDEIIETPTTATPIISDADAVNEAAEEAQRVAEEKARQEAQAKQQAEAEAKRKAEAEAKQKAEQQQVATAHAAQAKAEILQMVNRRESIANIRAHQGYEALSQVEQLAVETVYNLGNKKGAAKHKVKDYLEGKTFRSWDELIAARQEIIAIE